jgi:hypothetical protein
MRTNRSAVNRRPWIFLLVAAFGAAALGVAVLHAQAPSFATPGCTPGVNRPPVANDDAASTSQGVPVTISVLANDTDPDGNPLTVASVTQPTNGSVAINGGTTVTYKPAAAFAGVDVFTYVAKDGAGGMASATVAVTVKKPAPVLELGFNEPTGSIAIDTSPLANNGTIKEAIRVAGHSGLPGDGALSFDGVNDWVTVPDKPALRLTTGMTLEAWVRPTAAAGWTTVVQKERTTAGLAYSLYARDGAPVSGLLSSCSSPCTTKPAGYARINFIDQPIRGVADLVLNTWAHLAVTYGGGVESFYVNGLLVSSRALTGTIETSVEPVRIGGNLPSGEYFKGDIDDVRVYNVSLNTASIQADLLTPVR